MGAPGSPSLVRVYLRSLGLLAAERGQAVLLAAASVAIAVAQLAEPILFGRVVDALASGADAFPTIGLWAALGLFGIVAGVVVSVSADRLAHRRRMAAMAGAFERAITLPIGYHAARGTGAVVRGILAGTDALFALWLAVLRNQLTAVVSILLLIPTALGMNLAMASILIVLAALYAVLNVAVIRRTRAGQANVEAHHANVFGRVGDVIGNVTIVQSFTRLGAETEAMRGLMDRLLAAQYPVLTWWGVLTVLTRAAATIAMVLVLAVGAILARRGEVSVGEIVAFVSFATLLIGKLDQLSGFVAGIFKQTPTLTGYFDLLDAKAGVADRPGAPDLGRVRGAVRYSGVSMRFPGSDQGVFDLDFSVEPGRTVALVGPTGSGKSTTLALLQRLRDPDAGAITVDGHDITGVTLNSLRREIAVVFQEAGLFNRSIAENIRVGRPSATDAEVEEAARRAEADRFIARKQGGYGFVIGERGSALSGGERQRLAIARAILKDAPILILDEATSALDPETEAKIKRALDALRAGRTTFIIAHRLSTVADADEILVLDQGRIVERGTFRSLVAEGGLFARLVAEGGFTEPEEAPPQASP
ncbi:glucan ABC transporter ATP-binding protein/ permease [Amaricoccus solimangrovi]|uniref:Glucan ABC transporter ATP-binding protein/ permease n=1 Tax=Amaricoccus solimangrovi TaxID=2589815 RepID=A0A501WSZ9_9RHOB|nr:glucan ABC transporter ATP-binding protein/ permease [Amaricoccus solimangrovi]TPE50141.1 glucan ABC transporter ATP-binding protein/ permease [Amaricoccus solimangrovi]